MATRHIYLARHGEAGADGMLSEAGRQQASSYPPAELAHGASLAAAAIERFARPAEADSRELIVTHNFLIGWFIRDALGAPAWRWLGLNQCNAALTVIRYASGYPPALVSFNDMDHLPAGLRWTGFPAELRG